MTDRELLEMAAKAAGIKCEIEVFANGRCVGTNEYNENVFDPLEDDGDALRLAVKCHIEFYEGAGDGPEAWAGYRTKGSAKQLFSSEPMGGDPYAATRRAIVRAAAEIGKS